MKIAEGCTATLYVHSPRIEAHMLAIDGFLPGRLGHAAWAALLAEAIAHYNAA
ncbi:hypothetical protein GCM10009776_36780 [Microbacterium deminutum]|uniref:Uncharacterized protein n=1 Tax=Microbacterium deminutum TaxID=344164 RepID=A0ABN2RJS2_9MICO